MKEIWKPMPYEPFNSIYLVSTLGRIKVVKRSPFSRAKSKYLTHKIGGTTRYAHTTLYNSGKSKTILVHRAVALAFLGEPPVGKHMIRHLDGNPKNNRLGNLAWGNNTDNMQDMIKHGNSMRGELNAQSKLTREDVLEIRLRYERGEMSQTALAPLYGIDQTTISRIVLRKSWEHI